MHCLNLYKLLVVFVATLALAQVARAEQAVIKLKSHVSVSADSYMLADIAEVVSQDNKFKNELLDLRIGVAPRLGYRSYVSRQQLAHQLALTMPDLRGKLSWEGAKTVTIDTHGISFNRKIMVEEAERALKGELLKRYAQVELQPVAGDEIIMLPEGKVDFSVRLDEKLPTAKRMCVWVDVSVNNKFYLSVPQWFAIRAFADVLVAKAEIQTRALLMADKFVVVRRDVTALAGAPVSPHVDLSHLRLKGSLLAGAPLLESGLEVQPAVMRNQEVTVSFKNESINLETRGVALADGTLGGNVKIRSISGGEAFAATVIAPGLVAVGM